MKTVIGPWAGSRWAAWSMVSWRKARWVGGSSGFLVGTASGAVARTIAWVIVPFASRRLRAARPHLPGLNVRSRFRREGGEGGQPAETGGWRRLRDVSVFLLLYSRTPIR